MLSGEVQYSNIDKKGPFLVQTRWTAYILSGAIMVVQLVYILAKKW
jgi:hypothetical protein